MPNIVEVHHHIYYEYLIRIKYFEKISEGKINRNGLNKYEIGQIIRFYNHDPDEIHVRIIGKTYYNNFDEMLRNELNNVLPNINSVEEGLKIYRTEYPNRDEENRLGVIVIHFEIL